jgi:hypothetical protein
VAVAAAVTIQAEAAEAEEEEEEEEVVVVVRSISPTFVTPLQFPFPSLPNPFDTNHRSSDINLCFPFPFSSPIL